MMLGLGRVVGAIARVAAAWDLPRDWRTPDDDEIRTILGNRIEVQKQGVGIVVGVVDAAGRRTVAEGGLTPGDSRTPDGGTVFEIGSMTKVFTALLLADMAGKGEVWLDQPVAELLPAQVKVPSRPGRQISLADLATHTSALPGLPTNFAPGDADNPYADYTVAQLYAFLANYSLPYDIGKTYAYSNLGAGLLGHALARRAGSDYEAAVRARICGPMGLSDTVITLSPSLEARMAPGHDRVLEPAANWDLPTLAGAGALRSTVDDMLSFLAQAMDLQPSPLKPALDTLLTVRRPAGGPAEVALGWHVARAGRREVVWHNGGTGGYRSFFGFDPAAKLGVVVLTNLANDVGCDDMGFHILTGRPLAKIQAPVVRMAAVLSPAELDGLAGRYAFGGGAMAITVTVEDGRVMAQLTGQPAFEIYPENANRFFWKVVDAQATFERRSDGRAMGLTLHQAGRSPRARRVD